MTLDDDLRAALDERAGAEPATDGGALGEIHSRIRGAQRRRMAALGGAAVIVVVALAGAVLVVNRADDGAEVVLAPGSSSTTDTEGPTTTLAPGTLVPPATDPPPPAGGSTLGTNVTVTFPSTTVPLNPSGPYLWPSNSRDAGSTPKQVALDFAKVFGGMAAPSVTGERTTGANSEVDIKGLATAGTFTTVSLLQDQGRWMVLSARGSSILISTPTNGQNISSPVRVAGQCNTYEGHVRIEVRRRFSTSFVGEGFGTGMMGDLGPYEASISYQGTGAGAVVVSEPRVDDETAGPLQFTAVLVTL